MADPSGIASVTCRSARSIRAPGRIGSRIETGFPQPAAHRTSTESTMGRPAADVTSLMRHSIDDVRDHVPWWTVPTPMPVERSNPTSAPPGPSSSRRSMRSV